MSKNPKIGIRPTIDGRMNGVRESLEDQTMGMAQAVANLLSSKLRYADGTPVECVIADTTIGRVAETAACAEKFAREGVAVTITVTPCWCYGSETMDMDPHTIKAVWGFNGTERPGAVYLAAVLAAHAQKGLPAFGIYGHDVQDADNQTIPADVEEKLLRFARTAVAAASLRGKSYLSIGAVCMGIAGSIVNPDFFEDYLGMRVEGIDEVEIIRRMDKGIYDHEEFEKALAWAKAHCKEYDDICNREDLKKTRAEKDEDWAFVVKMALIIRDLLQGNPKLKEMGFGEESLGHNAILGGFQGQRPAIFADVRTYWSPEAVERVTGKKLEGQAANGIIHLINSGAATLDGSGRCMKDGKPAMKPFWEISQEEADACLDATVWVPANREYFRGGGFSSKFLSRGGMPCTMIRLNLIKNLGPALQIAEGWTVDIDPEQHRILDERTDKGWPTTWFAPRLDPTRRPFKDVYSVMDNWGANHGAIVYGHVGADLITLASMLRIPVCMHNVPEKDIFRPSTWRAFGMDPEGADYRACAAYGPLFKK